MKESDYKEKMKKNKTDLFEFIGFRCYKKKIMNILVKFLFPTEVTGK